MACVALKRQLDFDPIQTPRPAKRRRCMPMCIPGSDIPSGQSYVFPAGMANGQSFMAISPTSHADVNKVTQHMQNRIYSYRRPRRLYPSKQFIHAALNTAPQLSSSQKTSQSLNSPEPSPSTSPCSSPSHPSSSPSNSSIISQSPTSSEDERIFNIKQVVDMCVRTLELTERRLVREYSQELEARRREQYDHFLRFIADSLRHDGTTSSYLS